MKSVTAIALVFFVFGLKGSIYAGTPQVEITPKHVMVKTGDQVTVLCRAGEPTQYCRLTVPRHGVLLLDPSKKPRAGYSYAGDGLQNGQCGFKIDNVQEQNNGIHTCYMGFVDEASANMTIIVARPPLALPDLSLIGKPAISELQENDILLAICKVYGSRPAANITWLWDGIQIFDGLSPVLSEPSYCEETALCTVSQNLTRSVTWKDNGKVLSCVMSHFAQEIGSQNQTIFQLNVQYKPRDDETSTEQFGFEIGKPGKIVKQILANPRPSFQWDNGEGTLLNEGDQVGRYRADEAVNNGQGAWQTTLHIESLTADDVKKVYRLRATNNIGSTDYQVSISTLDPPTDVTLGAGAIVGIVASILIVLLIIFLVIFARSTGRWCFSGTRRNPMSTSDGATPGINPFGDIKKPKINLCNIFIRKNDKVADDSEELKGKNVTAGQLLPEKKEAYDVVYAELDLQQVAQPPVMHRAADKTEYAEIIHSKKKVNPVNSY